MTETTYRGRCFCGSIRYQVSGPILSLCNCHCESCRRAAGAPYVAWGTIGRDNFVVLSGKLSEHRSSPRVSRGLCGVCGTSLTYSHEARAGEIDVTLASLDDPAGLVPESHVWVEGKLPWVAIDDRLPQYDTVRDR